MTKRMLIDAMHPEEMRVVVLNANRLEDFDFETSTKKQLKGNIYLAKVTRVEPSLQAAFVEYGGNRHGFLAFNEIHPDYYHIPIADRRALAEQAAKVAAENDEPSAADARAAEDEGTATDDDPEIEVVSGDDIDEIERHVPLSRRYHIQEVIKRRDIMLVQVVKEERGTKGAALTTYISLAGRYCVLMPNAGRGGGISRKIVDPEDRKRLRAIATELPVPESMGVILRTAGMERSKAEIKRDFNYLLGLWESIRELTLKSIAPALIHEEANLIKRSIRDLYTRENEEVLVEGENGYRMAKEFMRTLIPSHAKRVKPYRDRIPLFYRYQVEGQLDAMHSSTVHLKSGGYVVISPTEALVAIDVNSGKATRERNIEETAYKTNLEAAEEIARQLRLRDLSGLIVIDFIDMDDAKNVRTVERRFKESIKNDRARIQMGRISPFGLLELSRQRLRPSLLEASSQVCSNCGGIGHIRSTESTALHVLRAIEEEGIRERSNALTVFVPSAIALYVLNQKRAVLRAIEERYGFSVFLTNDDSLIPPDYRLERVKAPSAEDAAEAGRVEADAEVADKTDRKHPRRRSKRRNGEEPEMQRAAAEAQADEQAPAVADIGEADDDEAPRKRRRRGKRGGRRRRAATVQAEAGAADELAPAVKEAEEAALVTAEAAASEDAPQGAPEAPVAAKGSGEGGNAASATKPAAAKPKRTRRTRRKRVEAEAPAAGEPAQATGEAQSAPPPAAEDSPEAAPEATAESPPEAETAPDSARPKRARRTRRKKAEAEPTPEAAKPKRARSPRRTQAESPPAAQEPAAQPVAEPAAQPGIDIAAAPPSPRRLDEASEAVGSVAAEPPGMAPEPAVEMPLARAEPAPEAPPPERPKRRPRRGWWQRLTS